MKGLFGGAAPAAAFGSIKTEPARLAIKPTKWEMPNCPKCGGSANYICGLSPQVIQGSAPPFVPMSDRPFPFYWESFESGGYTCESVCLTPPHPEARSSRYVRSVRLFLPSLLKDYETRLAHLCGLIARRRERRIHNYLVREPIADFNRIIDWVRCRMQVGIASASKALDVRFTLQAMRDGAESHICQPKFTALRGAALRGKA